MWTVRELDRPESHAFGQVSRRCRRAVFLGQYVHDGVGKVREPARMVYVEMRGHDVPHVLPRVTEGLDLVSGRLAQDRSHADSLDERGAEPFGGASDAFQPESR